MTGWDMTDTSCDASFRQIQYWCAPPAEVTTTLSCATYYGACQAVAEWEDLEFLEPLPVECPSSSPLLNRWQMTESGCSSTRRRMLYTCCNAVVPEPEPEPEPEPQLPESGGAGTDRLARFFYHTETLSQYIFSSLPIFIVAGGDPHFKLWSGTSYDFHGHCDLLLIESLTFANGAGLTIHIRSSPYRQIYSYISEAAVKIGTAVLWVGPGGKHSINNVPQQIGQTQAMIVSDELQYSITSSVTKRGRFVFKIHIGNEQQGNKEEIILRQYNNWITVNIMNPTETDFQSSYGLLGRFPDGALLGRDGSSIHANYIDFGSDWVIDSEKADRLLSQPNPFPGKCHLASLEKVRIGRRRLEQSLVSVEEAQKACAHWGDQVDNCVSDVLLLGDLTLAEDGPL
jgi:hypothetical protein